MAKIQWFSELECPECGQVSREKMPADYCQYYFQCASCDTLLKPEPGDCCVFCSYGSVPCPPVQQAVAEGTPSSYGNPE